MKFISKIKSISDVITNSSTEVFVMCQQDAEYYNNLENTNDCISINKIDWEWIKNPGRYECEMVVEQCGLDITLLESANFYKCEDKYYHYGKEYYWAGYPNEEDWEVFINMHRSIIEEKLIGKYWVDIEDHFENAYDVICSAENSCEWYEGRH